MADNILSDFGINILEEEIDDVIFQTNEFLTDATFTGSQGPFWWILQMCMALAALFSIIVAASMGRSGGYCRCAWLWPPCSRLSWRQVWPTR